MIFAKKGTSKNRLKKFNLNINKNHIKQVSLSKYLGVHLDNKLSWQEHINILQTKLSKFSGLVYRIRTLVPKKIIIMLYNALVGSYLRYGITSWGSSQSYLIKNLQSTQNKIIRNLQFLPSTAHLSADMFNHLKILNVENIYKHEVVKLIHSVHYNYCSPAFHNFFELSRHTYSTRLRQNSSYALSNQKLILAKDPSSFLELKFGQNLRISKRSFRAQKNQLSI